MTYLEGMSPLITHGLFPNMGNYGPFIRISLSFMNFDHQNSSYKADKYKIPMQLSILERP